MALKKIEQVKADKGFKIWDLVIYGVIVALAVVLFIVMFTTRNTDPLSGIAIYVRGEVVFEYAFGSEPQAKSEIVEVQEDASGVTVTIKQPDGSLNVAYIDKSAKTVKMTEANCRGRQCLYFAPLKNNSMYIYCDPHGIKIEPLLKDLDSPDIIM